MHACTVYYIYVYIELRIKRQLCVVARIVRDPKVVKIAAGHHCGRMGEEGLGRYVCVCVFVRERKGER